MEDISKLTDCLVAISDELQNVTKRLKQYDMQKDEVDNLNEISQGRMIDIEVSVFVDSEGKEYYIRNYDDMCVNLETYKKLKFYRKITIFEDTYDNLYYFEDKIIYQLDDIYHPTKPCLPGTYKTVVKRRPIKDQISNKIQRYQYCTDPRFVSRRYHVSPSGSTFGKWESVVVERKVDLKSNSYYYKDEKINLIDL